MDSNFNLWWGLIGLLPLIVYLILVMKEIDPLPATVICVVLGAIINGQSIFQVGASMNKALGSFLALVGFIIMLGRGLGEVLSETKVVHTLVYKIMYGIGVNTQAKAKFGIMISSLLIVGLLGTMSGGIAIIAPIVNPIASAVRLTPAVVGVIYQGVGEEALTLGPFTPPVVTLIGLTGLSYFSMLWSVALPIAVLTCVVTWLMTKRIQKLTISHIPQTDDSISSEFRPTKKQNLATNIFIALFLILIVWGIVMKASTSYVIVVMLLLSVVVGYVGGLGIHQIFNAIIKGMAGNVGLFLLFIFLQLFIGYVEMAGGFKALEALMMPLVDIGGKAVIVIAGGLIGAFGVSGAVVAELMTLHKMFADLLADYNVSMVAWATALIVATRVTNFVIPGANMVAMMGFANSKDLKSMLKNGYVVAIAQVVLLIMYAVFLA